MANISIPRNTKNATLAWGQVFVSAIEATPATYMVDAAVVTSLRTLVDQYQVDFDAFGVVNRFANNDATYTKVGRAALATSSSNFLGLASQVAVEIQANSAISDAAKLTAGVQPRNLTRTAVPAPSSSPLLDLTFATSGIHQIEYADINTPSLKAKPPGVVNAQAYMEVHAIGTPSDLANAMFLGAFTRTPIVVSLDPADNGMEATYWARWQNRKGEVGPFGSPTSGTIMF